jgi:hypothetical protein
VIRKDQIFIDVALPSALVFDNATAVATGKKQSFVAGKPLPLFNFSPQRPFDLTSVVGAASCRDCKHFADA